MNNPGYLTTDAVKNRKVYTVPAKHVLCVSQYIVNAVEDLQTLYIVNKIINDVGER